MSLLLIFKVGDLTPKSLLHNQNPSGDVHPGCVSPENFGYTPNTHNCTTVEMCDVIAVRNIRQSMTAKTLLYLNEAKAILFQLDLLR